MRIGFSFWGFLGDGVRDTPDGGRFWRRPLVDALTARGHDLVLLQADRDRREAGCVLPYRWEEGLPDLDALLLEWRWPLPGRNTTGCGSPGHHCDLHRQQQLLDHYTHVLGLPTLIWDTDRQMSGDDPLRATINAHVLDIAARGQDESGVLRACMVPDQFLDEADPGELARLHRPLVLGYVGNQYDRDDAFDAFLAPVARAVPHRIAGKWTQTQRWPGLNFTGRCRFGEIHGVYRSALATVLVMPDRYASVGAVSQRLPEAVVNGCVPILPAGVAHGGEVVPEQLHARDGAHALELARWLQSIAGTSEHADLIDECLTLLEPFRVSRQAARLDLSLMSLTRSCRR